MSKPLPSRPEPASGEKKPPTQAKPKTPRKPSPWPWGPARRSFLSVLLVLHVAAVFAAPWYIQMSDVFEPALPPGRAPRDAAGRVIPPDQLDPNVYPPLRPIVPQAIAGFFWHYSNLLYINNGYDFFSPDPSVNHLIRYEVRDDTNQVIVSGTFPDRREQWPRLLYHRYMMLVEQSSSPMNEDRGWELRIADWLLKAYNGDRVHLVKLRHQLLTPDEVRSGRRLNEESTYEVVGELDRRRGETLPAPSGEAGVSIPGGTR